MGGITLMWSHLAQLEIFNCFNYHIHAQVIGMRFVSKCHLIGFYGRPKTKDRHYLWDLLSQINIELGI